MTSQTTGRDWDCYQRSWDHEFEADRHAIMDVEDSLPRMKLIQGAILFLLHIYFHERITSAFDAEFAAIDSHPPTEDRLRRITEQFGGEIEVSTEWIELALERQALIADALIQHLRKNPDLMNTYGSIYLASWKGKELVDRVDY